MEKLLKLRKKIDKIDFFLLKLLSYRKKIIFNIGKIKSKLNYPIYDSLRENIMLKNRYIIANKLGINNNSYIKKIFTIICNQSYIIESKQKKINNNKKYILIIDLFKNIYNIFNMIFSYINYINLDIINKITNKLFLINKIKKANLIIINIPNNFNLKLIKFILKIKPNTIIVNFNNFNKKLPKIIYNYLGIKGTYISIQFLFNENIDIITKQSAIYYIYPKWNKNNFWFLEIFKYIGINFFYFNNLYDYNLFIIHFLVLNYFTKSCYIKFIQNYCYKNNKIKNIKYFTYFYLEQIKNNLINLKLNHIYYLNFLKNKKIFNIVKDYYNYFKNYFLNDKYLSK